MPNELIMVSTSDIKIKNILNMLSLQTSRNEGINEESIDHQFLILSKIIEKHFLEQNYELFFDWLNELIKREKELKKKLLEDFRLFLKDPLQLLISKVNKLHKKFIDLLIEDIEISYQDYSTMYESNPSFAHQVKSDALNRITLYLCYLTGNRSVNETLYDYYISLFTEALELFN